VNRSELVGLFLAVFVLVLAGLWLGWRNRGRRQVAIPDLPSVPDAFGDDLVPPLGGLYVGTTISAEWQNRIVVHTLGQRADAIARLTDAGFLIERQGSGSIFVPTSQLLDARLEPALAGKVVGKGGLLVVRWQHGEIDLDTGLRADDKTQYPAWVDAINAIGVIAHTSDRGRTTDE
jgi:hypothetical protein